MFSKFSLGAKQIGGFLLVALLTAAVGASGVYGVWSTSRHFDQCMDVEVPRTDAAMEGVIAIISGRDIMGKFLLNYDPGLFDAMAKEFKTHSDLFMRHSGYLVQNGNPEIKRHAAESQDLFKSYADSAAKLMELHRGHVEAERRAGGVMEQFDQHARQLAQGLKEHEATLARTVKTDPRVDATMEAKSLMYQQKAIAEEYAGLASAEATAELRKQFAAAGAEFKQVAGLLPPALVDSYRAYQAKALAMFDHRDQAMALRAASLAGMAKVDAASRHVVKAFEKVENIATASMNATMKQADGTERFFQLMVTCMTLGGFLLAVVLGVLISRSITRPINAVISGLSAGAQQVTAAAGQVSGSSQTLAQGASEQAAALEETSSSLEEMASMTKRNAEAAGRADEMMHQAGVVVKRANDSMASLRQAMERIASASNETAKIIKTIDEIAFQTNLLALNAAVEAARAGEAGAGFAVVADEVRSLALRAAEAAKNTSELIEGNITNIKQGSELVHQTDEAFGQVAASATQVGELVAEISAASGEQSQGIEQINTATDDMDKVTQQVAANAEESAAASEELSAQAQTMQGFVDDLVAVVTASRKAGETRGLPPGRPAPALLPEA